MKEEKEMTPDELRAENDFLKMKLMLENGAEFGNAADQPVPPEVENMFLKYVSEFENSWARLKKIKVYDKLGRPQHFLPVSDIPDDQVEKAWNELSELMQQHGINLDACSPNVTARDLYNFVLTELFDYEMDDISVEGLMHCFIYDEFHPDPVYENSMLAMDECIRYILETAPVEWTHHYSIDGIQVNEKAKVEVEAFKTMINNFKLRYNEINLETNEILSCVIEEGISVVKGKFSVLLKACGEDQRKQGMWEVGLIRDADLGYWYINRVRIEGFDF